MNRALWLLVLCSCGASTERQVFGSLIFDSEPPQLLGTGANVDLDDRARVEALLKEQAALLRSEDMVRAAVGQLSPPASGKEAAAFRNALTIDRVPNSPVLEIVLHGEPPRAIDLCNALLDGYLRRRYGASAATPRDVDPVKLSKEKLEELRVELQRQMAGNTFRRKDVRIVDRCQTRFVIYKHWWNR